MSDYKVGYKKPPESGKIRKGECRNPNGRRGKKPKPRPESTNVKDILERLENELIEFQGRKITKLEARLRVLQTKALQGDIRANQCYEGMCQRVQIGNHKLGGVLVVPGTQSVEAWSIQTAIQQAKYREMDPDVQP